MLKTLGIILIATGIAKIVIACIAKWRDKHA